MLSKVKNQWLQNEKMKLKNGTIHALIAVNLCYWFLNRQAYTNTIYLLTCLTPCRISQVSGNSLLPSIFKLVNR